MSQRALLCLSSVPADCVPYNEGKEIIIVCTRVNAQSTLSSCIRGGPLTLSVVVQARLSDAIAL